LQPHSPDTGFEHECPLPHTMPHDPQWLVLDFATQLPPQQ
jgi:hypothetical protein